MLMCLHPAHDAEQDRAIGAFRPYLQGRVPRDRPAIEVGPSFSPLIPKRLGFQTRVVDHADQATLVAKYRGQVPDVDVIEEVDVIWHGEPLTDLLPAGDHAAIVASHVIEHAPDFLGFLKQLSALLAADGQILMIVPDRRFCFDAFHPLSDVAKVLADYRLERSRHSFESFYRVSSQIRGGGELGWGQGAVPTVDYISGTPPNWLTTVEEMTDAPHYIDNHENYFTPSSFALLIEETRYLGLLDLSIGTITRTRGPEFLVILEKAKPETALDQPAFTALKKALHLSIIRDEAAFIAAMQPHIDQLPYPTAAG